MFSKAKYLTGLIFLLFFLQGCEKDAPVAPLSINIDKGAELLQYLEGRGDYVNNNTVPYISADQLYSALGNVLIIDIRKNSDYLNGHIEGAKNISGSALLDTLNIFSKDTSIVLVSGTGEASAYYAALLRFAGFNNLSSLSFGMASWNSYFSGVWTSRLRDYPEPTSFSTEPKLKDTLYSLPDPGLEESNHSIEEKCILKIRNLLDEGFNEDPVSASSGASINFDNIAFELNKYYVVCAGPQVMYFSKLYATYHLTNAVNYHIYPYLSDFRSISYLQALPNNQNILVYSGSGQESAFITAYLRLLGYNASSILLGCNNFSYSMLNSADEIRGYRFDNSVIRNYPYIH